MKKSSFIAMILGVISLVFFALGMCMAMLPEWNAFKPGVVCGCIGMVLTLVTVFVWRRMENKKPIVINAKTVGMVIVGIIGVFALGIGMCFTMVWGEFVAGVIIGLIGIVVLLCLIPLVKGIQ